MNPHAPARGGLDLGGTNIQAVVTGARGKVAGTARRNTPASGGPEALVRDLALSIREAAAESGLKVNEVAGVGVGVPGEIDADAGTVAQMANVEDWEPDYPLGPALSEALGGLPVRLGNDVNVAVEAERRYGAGRGLRSFIGVYWGTGIGGGLVVDGRLLVGRGSAGEIGHISVKPGGRRCACGQRGCLEAYAGRAALEARARNMAKRRKTVLFDLMRERERDRLTSGIWIRALEAGDEVATELLNEAVKALGVGIGAAVTLLDVEAVVLGGGLGERLGPAWLKKIEKAARPHTFYSERPVYRLAELGDLGGAIGASLLVGGRPA